MWDRFIRVKPGDSLVSIANRYGRRYDELFEFNAGFMRNPNMLLPGMLLRIPHDWPVAVPQEVVIVPDVDSEVVVL